MGRVTRVSWALSRRAPGSWPLYCTVLYRTVLYCTVQESTRVLAPRPRTIPHTHTNNLWLALRGSGSSFGIVTEFLYMINET